MAAIIDLKLQVIEEEIDQALNSFFEESHRRALAQPELRQHLISYVSSQVSGCYLVMNWGNQKRSIKQDFAYYSQALRLQIETHIYNGIHQNFEKFNI
jgi:hypothetical protein